MNFKDFCEEYRLNLLSKIATGKKKQHYQDKYSKFMERKMTPDYVEKNIERLRKKISKKLKKKKKIKVYFAAFEKSQWGMSSIYEAMVKDDCFEPKIFVLKAWEREFTEQNASDDLLKFFKDKHYDIVTEINKSNMPDIIFSARIDFHNIGLNLRLWEMYNKILFCYFPYNWVMEAERVDKVYFTHDDTKYFWKEYVPDERIFNASMSNPVKGKNVVLSGHPKTDEITCASNQSPYWKQKDTKKIIWAPHWSLSSVWGALGMFHLYYKEMYEYLKTHPEIEMIIKPHPFLHRFIADKALQKTWRADLKITIDEYNEFIENWKSLPNGNFMDSGDYFDLFKSSDAMIQDCVSFIAEYGFLCKPMCFCSRTENKEKFKSLFNSLAQKILDTTYIAYKWEDIVDFIENVVVNGNHPLKDKQIEVKDRYLSVNAGHVGEFIKDDIKKALTDN